MKIKEFTAQKWLQHEFGTRQSNPKFPFVLSKQVHSGIIHVVESPDAKLRGDAFITATPGIAVAVATADCLPVLVADPEHRVVAAVHAGWRGTLKRIVEKTIGEMRKSFGSNPAKLLVALGPSIHACCYEVGPEVIEDYRSQFPYADELFENLNPENPALVMLPRQHFRFNPNATQNAVMRELDTQRAHLNVEEANVRQLLAAGVPSRRIVRGAPCTGCRLDLLHSYRKQGPGSGRQIAAIGIR